MSKERILLIYQHLFLDSVDEKTSELAGDDDDPNHPTVYHIHEDDAEFFIKENGKFTKIFFTGNISEEHKKLFSSPPYNGKKMG
ncbi:MAG TPA: hypothetical protein PLQ20_01375 [Candidatus Paceibacterota bacterium]|jgi:hypothetical protein|nr:hypothetical protein [Candidatus Paceibacterota bacterium]